MRNRSILTTVFAWALAGVASAAAPDGPVYELRTYYAPPGRLDDLHARFRDHTIKLFDRHGLVSIGYWTPVENPDNKLIYLLSFPSPQAHDEAWKAFFADPQWAEVAQANGGPRADRRQSGIGGAQRDRLLARNQADPGPATGLRVADLHGIAWQVKSPKRPLSGPHDQTV